MVARTLKARQDAHGLRAGATIAVLGGLCAERRPTVATKQLAFLPRISDVDTADEHLGRFMSALDSFASEVDAFSRDPVPLDDAHFLFKAGIEYEHRERHADPATIARLLVFADEVLDNLEYVRAEATRLRKALLTIYRYQIIESERGGDVA
jgi:hypothetical protein